MTWGAVAIAGGSLVGSVLSSNAQANAASDAANAQAGAAQAGIDQQNQRFAAIQKLLEPYVNAGTSALGQQGDLVGINGQAPQQAAIDALRTSPQFTSMLKQGENSILANASATGGLRGGNTQAALSQFSPTLLAQVINDQYNKLGGLTSIGQNAAAGTGNAGMSTGTNISNLLQQQGAAVAGGALAEGRAQAQMYNAPFQALSLYSGLGGKLF